MRGRPGSKRSRSLPLVLAVLLAACGPGAPAEPGPRAGPAPLDGPAPDAAPPGAGPEIPEAAPTVVFLGDSIGAGLHLSEQQAFPAVLQRRLAAEGLPFRLVNASESGRTSAGGVTALEWVLRTEPELVVLELGGNDGLRGVPIEDVERNLRALIEGARARGARVLLLGLRLPPNYGDYAARFDGIYPRLAQEYGLAFVPYFMQDVGGVPELNLPDGLHPTAEGHERLAENLLPTLRELLRETRAPASNP